ncbi:MAG: TPM domain-containing protein [Bacteroidota bacterium]
MTFKFLQPLSDSFFTEEEDHDIVMAIKEAERKTSGEIRIHLESRAKKETEKRAWEVFEELDMFQTEQRNGVLIYLAIRDRKFSIVADEGINKAVPDDFWDEMASALSSAFKSKQHVAGLITAVGLIGDKLREYFPYEEDDENELPDEISFG